MKRIITSLVVLIYLAFVPQIFAAPKPPTEPLNNSNASSIEPPVVEPIEEMSWMEISVLPPSGNSYTPGYCTWYVANKRYVPPGLGNANTWASRAPGKGLTVSDLPMKGAIAWASYIGGLGHVAYVEEVYDGGNSALISEMNMNGRWSLSSRVITPSQGWRFIY